MIATRFNPLGKDPPKPYAYEVKYLRKVGNNYNYPYIDTGINLSSRHNIEFTARANAYSSFYTDIFGVWDGMSTYYVQTGSGGATRTTIAFGSTTRRNFGTNNEVESFDFGAIACRDGVWTCEGNNGRLDLSSVNFEASSLTAWYGAANNSSHYYRDVSLGALKISLDGVLLGHWIPVVDYDGVACWYDEVSKQFFYNLGTGSFEAVIE